MPKFMIIALVLLVGSVVMYFVFSREEKSGRPSRPPPGPLRPPPFSTAPFSAPPLPGKPVREADPADELDLQVEESEPKRGWIPRLVPTPPPAETDLPELEPSRTEPLAPDPVFRPAPEPRPKKPVVRPEEPLAGAIEELVRNRVHAALLDVSRELVPPLTERLLKDEIDRLSEK